MGKFKFFKKKWVPRELRRAIHDIDHNHNWLPNEISQAAHALAAQGIKVSVNDLGEPSLTQPRVPQCKK